MKCKSFLYSSCKIGKKSVILVNDLAHANKIGLSI